MSNFSLSPFSVIVSLDDMQVVLPIDHDDIPLKNLLLIMNVELVGMSNRSWFNCRHTWSVGKRQVPQVQQTIPFNEYRIQ